MDNEISIEGIDQGALLASLHNNSSPPSPPQP
jgi:hypothetical protein